MTHENGVLLVDNLRRWKKKQRRKTLAAQNVLTLHYVRLRRNDKHRIELIHVEKRPHKS